MYILFLLLGISACQKQNQFVRSQNSSKVNTSAQITVSKKINAGENIIIRISTKAINRNEEVQLVISDRFTTRVESMVINNNTSEYNFQTTSSGLVKIYLNYKGITLDQAYVLVNPLEATGKMESSNGPKSLVVNDDVSSMLVAIPRDKYGNPMRNGAPVTFTKQYAGNNITTTTRPVKNLVAFEITNSLAQTGIIKLGANSGQAYLTEQEIEVQAAMPSRVEIRTTNYNNNADGRELIQIETNTIKDDLGNVVENGTSINFIVKDGDRFVGSYSSFTVNGRAKVQIQNPSKACTWSITAELYGSVTSNALELKFLNQLNKFDYTINKNEGIITVGPVSTIHGQLAPDGTTITLHLNQNTKTRKLTKEVEDGYVQFNIPSAFNLDINIECRIIAGDITREFNFIER